MARTTSDRAEGAPVDFKQGSLAGEVLPSLQSDVGIDWRQLNGVAGTACHLSRDDRGAGAGERLVDCLARVAVVLDRPAHALHRFLRAVAGIRLTVLDWPDRGLFAVTIPMAGIVTVTGSGSRAGDRQHWCHEAHTRSALPVPTENLIRGGADAAMG
jgi:hypothetical protein